ncbi:MAG: 23S rRNA (pseudouridine(1915)-N(3))-methyltransferase RlmH [Pseudomonadota bacterium]
MKIRICAVGRLKAGPEKDLVDDYLARFDRSGRNLGLGPVTVFEVEDRKAGGKAGEAAQLLRAVPDTALLCCMDERGKQLSSRAFAAQLAEWRDAGRSELALVIGGADGLDPSIRTRADLSLSLGNMVWPHMLVRAMLAEQLYRSATILAGAPYHRD